MRFRYSVRKMVELFVYSEDPDQMPHSAPSDLGLHCLLITPLGVSRLQWVNGYLQIMFLWRNNKTINIGKNITLSHDL